MTTPLGQCPAWHVPAAGDTWVILVHGRGGSRREALRMLPALHRAGHPALAITYRNDEEAPASPDGHYHLGDTEWLDVEAAVRLGPRPRGAADRAVRLVHGRARSSGRSSTGRRRRPRWPRWCGTPRCVDWRATLRRQARNRWLPSGLAPLATAVTRRRIGIDFDRFDLLRRPPAVRPPTLLVHSSEDTVVPVGPSRALAAAAAALDWPIRYLEVPGAEHTGSWNADPEGYERAVSSSSTEVLR